MAINLPKKWKFTMLKTDIFVETIHVRLNNASLVGQLLIIWDIIVTHLKISNNQNVADIVTQQLLLLTLISPLLYKIFVMRKNAKRK